MSELTSRFCASLEACGGAVTHTVPDALADTVAALVEADGLVLLSDRAPGARGERPAPGVASSPSTLEHLDALRHRGVEARLGTVVGLTPADGSTGAAGQALRGAGAAITGALFGVASLGTVVVAPHGGNDGLLACLAPHHVVILREEDIVADLAAAFERLGAVFAENRGEFVFVTGPSRTADIEMMTVLGVHGPLRLDVVVVTGASSKEEEF
jgi:hypothetical protein